MKSLKASPTGLETIDQARRRKKWNKTATTWINQAYVSKSTLNRFWAGQPIRAESFVSICETVGVDWQAIAATHPSDRLISQSQAIHQDWGDAPEVESFLGRSQEQAQLTSWITQDRCRLISVYGMGGIGKTTLVSTVAQQLQTSFEFTIWRSLRNVPAFTDLIRDIQSILDANPPHLPDSDSPSHQLLALLRRHRCLIIFDNLESILKPPSENAAGHVTHDYCEEYFPFKDLLMQLANAHHQSCILITTRELPCDLPTLEGNQLPVRSLCLTGINPESSRELCQLQGAVVGLKAQWQRLHQRYGGNPLALKIVAGVLTEVFNGQLGDFLDFIHQGNFVLDDVRHLLNEQFQRLAPLEKNVMYWLAINREPVTVKTLQEDLGNQASSLALMQALRNLGQRSLIEQSGSSFSQQPVVMEFVITELLQQVMVELQGNGTNTLTTFCNIALVKPQIQDYLYETQQKVILVPLSKQLNERYSPSEFPGYFQQILAQIRPLKAQARYGPGNLINLMRWIGISLREWDFSRLPIWQADLRGLALPQVIFHQADVSKSLFTEVIGNSLSAAFCPHGVILATSDNGYTVRIWDIHSGKLHALCQGHTHWTRCVAFANCELDGIPLLIASGSGDRTLRLWDATTGIELKTLLGHTDEIFALAFAPQQPILASGSGDRTIRLWNVETGACLAILTGHCDRVKALCFSPTRPDWLVSGSEDGTIKLWSIQEQTCLYTFPTQSGWVRSVKISADGQLLATGGDDGQLRIWNLSSQALIQEIPAHSGGLYTLDFSPQGDMIATGGADHLIKLWDVLSFDCVGTLVGHGNQIYSVAFSPTENQLVGVSLDRTIKLWDWGQNQCLRTWQGYTDWGFPIRINATGDRLMSGSGGNQIHLWNLETQGCIHTLSGLPALVRAIAFTSHPDHVLVAGAAADIELWSWKTQQRLQVFQGHRDWIFDVAMVPQLNSLDTPCDFASCGADHDIFLWSLQRSTPQLTLSGHGDQVNALAFCPQQPHILASGSADGTVKLWNWHQEQCIATFKGHHMRVYQVAFHPTQPWLVSAGSDLTLKIWDWQQQVCLQTLAPEQGWLFAIAISPCGMYLASAGQDGSIQLWDLEKGECLWRVSGHQRPIYALCFDPRGTYLASGSQDQIIRFWDLNSGQCFTTLSARLYEGLDLTGVKGLSAAQRLTLQELGAKAN